MPSPSKAAKPILYSYWRSSCSWRVRAALAFKQMDFDLKAVHLVKDGGQQYLQSVDIPFKKTEEYTALNPAGVVPTLVIDGQALTESMAILEYLEETKPKPSLFPADPVQKAQVRGLCLHIVSAIQPLQNLKVLTYIGDEKKAEWGHYWIHRGFIALEKMLTKTAGTHCFGNDVTMADICLEPQIYNAVERFKVDLTEFPTISKVHNVLQELDIFKESHASNQPDTPESEKNSSRN